MKTPATKLGIVSTHPIQYYTPIFQCLEKMPSLDTTVYFCQKPSPQEQGLGFGINFEWDTDLLSGYRYQWLENISKNPNLSSFDGCDTPAIKEIIQKERFDAFLVLGWNKKSFHQAIAAAKANQVPILVRADNHLKNEHSLLKKFVKKSFYPAHQIRQFDACLAVGKYSKEYFEAMGAKRIIMSPHSVDNDWFFSQSQKLKPKQAELKAQLQIDPRATVFLFVGKFQEGKGTLEMVQAFEKFLKENTSSQKFHLLMVGDGLFRSECQKIASKKNLPISLPGFYNQSKLPQAYAVSDILVLPSPGGETWGLVVNEAMACALPAAVSDKVGCGPDLILDDQTGFIFEYKNLDSLVDILKKVSKHPDLKKMGQVAQLHIQNYSPQKSADGILEATKLGVLQ